MYLKFNRRGVRFGFALIGGVCVSLPLLKCSAVRAAAANLESYTLSPSQALALYGTELFATYYNGSEFEKVSLQYIGNTYDLSSRYGYPSDGTPTYCAAWNAIDTYNTFLTRTYFEDTCYLIYKWETDIVASAANVEFSIQLQNAINIDTYGFETSVFWSRTLQSVYPGLNCDSPYYVSSYTLYGASILDVLTYGDTLRRPGVTYEYGMIRTMPISCMFADGQNPSPSIFNNTLACTFLGMSAFAGTRESGSDYITVGQSTINIKLERPVECPQIYDPSTGSTTNIDGPAVYILLQCPKLYGDYVLPPVNNGDNIDLSVIESYLSDSNDSLLNISEESTVQTRQLIAILAKLEQIYQKIPSVDLSVPALSTAPSIPIDSTIDNFVSSEFENADSVLDQDALQDLENLPVNDFLGLASRVRSWFPVEIVTIWGILLVVSFVSWFIFRGRGG